MAEDLELESPKPDIELREVSDAPPDDRDWKFESHSADEVTTPPPDDTTVAAITAEGETPTDEAGETVAESDEGDSGEESVGTGDGLEATPDAKAAADTEIPPETKPKKGDAKLKARITDLQGEVNTLTYTKHQTIRETQEAEARLAAAKRELASLGQPSTPVTPDATATPTTQPKTPQPTEDLPPVAPLYTEFSTDEEYRAAVTEHQRATAAWMDRREAKIREEVTQGLETRLTAQQRQAQAESAREAYNSRLDAARAAHAEDWDSTVQQVADVRSSWADPNVHKLPSGQPVAAPFLWDVVENIESGPELLYWLGQNPTEAQALAELRPTMEMRHSIVNNPSPDALLHYFATPDGQRDFERIKVMPPALLNQEIGRLHAQLTAAPRGSAPAVNHPITTAPPPVRPPRGTPPVRDNVAPNPSQEDFDAWMASEDKREAEARLRAMGVRP